MSILQQARKALFGETWALPIAVTLMLGSAVVFKSAAGDTWGQFGGPFLLAGTALVLVVLVDRGRRR